MPYRPNMPPTSQAHRAPLSPATACAELEKTSVIDTEIRKALDSLPIGLEAIYAKF